MLGTRIALLRIARGWSQAELAKKIGVSASAVGMYEQGRREPSLDLVVSLAREFGVSTDFLLTGECRQIDLARKGRIEELAVQSVLRVLLQHMK